MTKNKRYNRASLRSLIRSRNALIGLVIVGGFLFAAAFSSIIAVSDPYEIDLGIRELAPSLNHLFGTDSLGRDIFSRVVYGARISLKVGILAMTISVIIGTVLGAIAGYFGGVTDTLIMRITDIFLAMPAPPKPTL